MSKWKQVRALALTVAALTMGACSTSYDCSSADVTAALVQEAASSGYIPYMKQVPADWNARFTNHTTVKNIVTLDQDDGVQHYRCRANLHYGEGARTVSSKDITYEVRQIEGADDFTLEWEVENNGIVTIDPIKQFAMDVQGPWKGELEKQLEQEIRSQNASRKEEARTWARGFAAEYAAQHPPMPFDSDALKKYADDFLSGRDAEPVMEQFHDIDGDGIEDYFMILAKSEYDEGQFAGETQNYGEYTNTGGFMRKNYFFLAVTQTFKGFGLETSMGLHDGKVTSVDGEKVASRYLPRDIASLAKAPPNPIASVTHSDGDILVSLTDGKTVTIQDFKPEKSLEQVRQERLQDLEDRLARLRENGDDLSTLYQ